jgi:hypothetical protein
VLAQGHAAIGNQALFRRDVESELFHLSPDLLIEHNSRMDGPKDVLRLKDGIADISEHVLPVRRAPRRPGDD